VPPNATPALPPPAQAAHGVAGIPGFSAAEVWPEAERENVRTAEALLAAGDATNAVLACELLLTRVLAGAAAIVGTDDAPRDPSLVALLLGIEGARYLRFRARVKSARQRLPVTMRDAWECFALALDARLARERAQAQG
jgi:hypothetical protein